MAVRLWDWLLHRVLGKHVADCSHSLGGGRAAVMHCAPAISRARERRHTWHNLGPCREISRGKRLSYRRTHPVKHGAFLGVAPQSRNDCQQKAHQFCLPMCVGLIEDVLQVSLDCGHRKRQVFTDRLETVTPQYPQRDVGLGIR